MKLNRSDKASLNLIKTSDAGDFLVNEVLYTHSIIVTGENVVTDWNVQSVEQLTIADFDKFAAFDAEIFILGTGKNLIFPDANLFQPLIDQRCGYEVMNSHSACITFNILNGDDRKVVAALLPAKY